MAASENLASEYFAQCKETNVPGIFARSLTSSSNGDRCRVVAKLIASLTTILAKLVEGGVNGGCLLGAVDHHGATIDHRGAAVISLKEKAEVDGECSIDIAGENEFLTLQNIVVARHEADNISRN